MSKVTPVSKVTPIYGNKILVWSFKCHTYFLYIFLFNKPWKYNHNKGISIRHSLSFASALNVWCREIAVLFFFTDGFWGGVVLSHCSCNKCIFFLVLSIRGRICDFFSSVPDIALDSHNRLPSGYQYLFAASDALNPFVVQSRTLYTACGRRTARAYGRWCTGSVAPTDAAAAPRLHGCCRCSVATRNMATPVLQRPSPPYPLPGTGPPLAKTGSRTSSGAGSQPWEDKLAILPFFGKRKQVTYHVNLSYWCFHISPSVLFFHAKFYASTLIFLRDMFGKTSWYSIDVSGNDRHILLFYKKKITFVTCFLLPKSFQILIMTNIPTQTLEFQQMCDGRRTIWLLTCEMTVDNWIIYSRGKFKGLSTTELQRMKRTGGG